MKFTRSFALHRGCSGLRQKFLRNPAATYKQVSHQIRLEVFRLSRERFQAKCADSGLLADRRVRSNAAGGFTPNAVNGFNAILFLVLLLIYRELFCRQIRRSSLRPDR